MNYYKTYWALAHSKKVPRKAKKAVLGYRMSSSKLKRLLKQVVVVKSARTMYERPKILPYAFCPKCGCEHVYGTGNMESYPEHFEYFNCLRCMYLVGMIENSPFYHVLQFAPEFELP